MTYGRPGVYINERLLPAPIAATGTANAAGAAVGEFSQGPTDVTLVTSWYDFVKKFGGYNAQYPATFGVSLFFQNGGSELYVQRILHTTDETSANNADWAKIDIVDAAAAVVGVAKAKDLGEDGNNLRVKVTASTRADEGSLSFRNLTVYKEVANGDLSIVEQFNNVVFSDSTSNDFAATVVNLNSEYITLTISDTTKTPVLDTFFYLAGGSNGIAATSADYTANIDAFTALDRPLVIFAPEVITRLDDEAAGQDVQNALIDWATLNNSFAVVDTPANQVVVAALATSAGFSKSSHGAAYYPNIYISDPVGRSSSSLRKVGPAGAIAGLYIQTDKTVGPFKAPAGLYASVRGAVALERSLTAAELDAVNTDAAPLNALRNLPGAGVVSMGARTLLQDGTANKYVNMRRSLIYIKKNLETLSQFALFENNDERLWARLRTVLGGFLNDYRNQGGLRGDTPAAAFYVKVDEENNTVNTIALGECHIEIGVALQYPTEFVVINLSQKTAV